MRAEHKPLKVLHSVLTLPPVDTKRLSVTEIPALSLRSAVEISSRGSGNPEGASRKSGEYPGLGAHPDRVCLHGTVG